MQWVHARVGHVRTRNIRFSCNTLALYYTAP